MRRASFAVALVLTIFMPAGAQAAKRKPVTAAEMQTVRLVSRDMQRRFRTPAAAARAGYFRYTDEDETGAISWVNTRYWNSDLRHPSQLWYDARGRLIGIDLSLPKSATLSPPRRWNIDPSRWFTFRAHVHYALRGPNGALIYKGAPQSFIRDVGGDPEAPTAADLVKAHKAPDTRRVAFVFAFPAIWDLEFWLVPNPLGPFAETNPNVKPSRARTSM